MPGREDNHAPLLIGRLRRAVGLCGGTGQFSAVLFAVGVTASFLTIQTAWLTLAIVVLSACLANVGRIAIHLLLGGYLWLSPAKIRASEKPAVRRHLSSLVVANIALTLLGLAGGIALIAHPDAPLLWRVVPVGVLSLAFYLVALATVERADELDLKRGTELVRKSGFGGWLFKIGRNGTGFRPVAWLVDLFDKPTPLKEPSTLAVLIAVGLLFVPVATVEIKLSFSAKEAIKTALVGDEEKDRDGKVNGGEKPQQAKPAPITVPIYGGFGMEAADHLRVVVTKTDPSHPDNPIPLSQSDMPYVLAALPVILRLRQRAEASGDTWGGGTIHVTLTGKTLSYKVVGQVILRP